jgi:hypothetical protein
MLSRSWKPALGFVIALIAMMVLQGFVLANPGLKVEGAIAEFEASPGEIYIHRMFVKSYQGDPPMGIVVKAYGFGQALDGAYKALSDDEIADYPYSAHEFITHIENSTFNLEPGGTEEVLVTIDVPTDLEQSGGKYALVHVQSQLDNLDQINFVPSIYIPVVLNFGNWDIQGEIIDMSMNEVQSGKPIEWLVTFRNTGNYHYKAKNLITIEDALGEIVCETVTPLTAVSIIPAYAYQFKVELDLEQGLPQGTYSVTSEIMLEDGTGLDTQTTQFSLESTYVRNKADVQTMTPFTLNWAFIGITIVFVVLSGFLILSISRRRRI